MITCARKSASRGLEDNNLLICYSVNEIQLDVPEYRVKYLDCEWLVAIVAITRAATVDVLSAHYLGPLWLFPCHSLYTWKVDMKGKVPMRLRSLVC